MTGLKCPPEASGWAPDWDSASADLLHEWVSVVLVTLSFLSQTVPSPLVPLISALLEGFSKG